MKRLAIVDLAHGNQPMANEDESIVLVYNGEVYNAPQIRAELEREGIRFRTRSDTEVILRLYERNPDDVEERLVGMWGFAIHDRKRRRVVLSRDRFGIKPLFVADAGGALAFASELRAFDRAIPAFSKCFGIDHRAAHAMLSWSYVPETATIYAGVCRLAPASRMTIDLASKRRTTERYWNLAPSSEAARIGTLDDACAFIEPVLRRAVREHLESDVPVATLLSGGIDSSLISQFAAEESAQPIKTYSIGFREKSFDESPFARETAAMLGVENVVGMFDEEIARRRIPDALLAYDEPFGDSSSLATYLVCEEVARDYKVALGGDGGDEVFAGYKKYKILHARRALRWVPRVRDGLGNALLAMPARTDRTRGWTELLRTARRLARGLSGGDAAAYAQLTQVSSLARTGALLAQPAAAEELVESAERRYAHALGSDLQRTLAADMGNPLVNDMLVKVDRASMAHHLEARVPFLDHRVVEAGLGLPERFTLGRDGKRVLRALHERRFGKALANRKKQGFGVPVEKWLRGPLAGACERLFAQDRLERDGVLSSVALSGGRFREWLRTDPILLWHAFALASWCEINLGGGESSLREILAS
jgi:asparagine synthase (glutamine-hydrolysing)